MSLELEIQVHEQKQQYTSNDSIAGTVTLKVLQEQQVEEILIACQCVSQNTLQVGSKTARADHQHYKKDQNRPINRTMPPGEYRYPFAFTLPSSGQLPETYSSGEVPFKSRRGLRLVSGTITWEIRAAVPRFKLFDISFEARRQFWFIPKLATTFYETTTEHSFPPIPIKPSLRFRRREPIPNIYFTVQLRDSGIHQTPGTAGIRLKLVSDTERLLFVDQINLHLEATTTFKLRGGQRLTDVSQSNIFSISPHLPLGLDAIDLEMCTDEQEFELPTMFYGSMETPLLSLKYNLVIEADIGMFSDPRFSKSRQVRLPVQVRSLEGPDARQQPGLGKSQENTAPFLTSPIMPRELQMMASTSTNSPDISLPDTLSSTSIYELWEPNFDDDISALVFKYDSPQFQAVPF